MAATNAGAAADPPEPENGKATGEGGDSVRATAATARVSISAEAVKREASHHFMFWLKTGICYHRRLARAAADAARKS